MNQERRFPKIIKEKGLKKTDEMPTEETLFEGFDSLWPPTLEGVKRLGKELSEYPELKPRMTFFFPLDKERREAIKALRTGEINEKMAINLLKSDDFVKQDAGGFLLKKIKGLSEKGIAELQSILENKEWKEKNSGLAEKIKVKIILETKGNKAFEDLIEMTEDKNWESQKAAVEGLGELGDERALALPVLRKLYNNSSVIDAASKARTKIILKTKRGKDAIETWKKTAGWDVIEGKARAMRDIIMDMVEKEGEKAMPALKELSQDENIVSRPAAQALARLIIKTYGEKSDEVLKETFKNYGDEINYDDEVERAVEIEKNKHEWLLGTQKAIFATPHTETLIKGVVDLQKIYRELKKKGGDKFVGFNIFGSASKGYFERWSDIDFGIIAEKDGRKELVKKLPFIPNCELVDEIIINGDDTINEKSFPGGLFHGIFIGDYPRLIQVQKNSLENTDENQWDRTREIIIDRELANFEELAERFGIAGEKLERLEQATVLSRVPPPYEETLKLVKKREKMLSKAKRHTNFGK